MFYTGSEVVVIGSNVKIKNNVRKGSVGNIIQVQNPILVHKHCLLPAVVSFSRYGYEKKDRFETKLVYINSFSNIKYIDRPTINFRKCINKFIQQTSNIKINCPSPVVVLAPINNFVAINFKKEYGRIISYITSLVKNPFIFKELSSIVHGTTLGPNTFRNNLTEECLITLQRLIDLKHNDFINTLKKFILHDSTFILETVCLLNDIKVLIIRNNRKPNKYPLLTTLPNKKNLINYIFMEYEYKQFKGENRKNIDSLKAVIIEKGRLEHKA